MTSKALVVFTKAPVKGQVKTRLAVSVGDDEALQAHVRLVESALTRLSTMHGVRVSLCLSQDHAAGRAWSHQFKVSLSVQAGCGLGVRMAGVFSELFDRPQGGIDQIVLVGGDCPCINEEYVDQAFRALDTYPVVLGPTEDGGYGLIGMRRQEFTQAKALFNNIEWGSDRVMIQTRAALRSTNCPWQELDMIWDVDDAADWQRYLNEFGSI